MNKGTFLKAAVSFFIIATFVFITQGYAEDIKARMKERLPAIKELKAKGIVGENNKGYLEFIGDVKEGEDIVNDENNDRKEVYKAIAAQQGIPADIVSKRRAMQIADKAAPGEWLQNENGEWYKK
ncbi:MAG: DUF1318 domain-containing protein [wastewater metagenome]|nr:DUF1318 domain-containing protein [Candidatus Loosdrechtia aerotolerans]